MDARSALLVGLGSFFGGVFRYLTVYWIDRKAQGTFPLSVLAANAFGSFLIGVAAPYYAHQGWGRNDAVPLLLSVGVLGGYTTFSTFSLQTFRLLQAQEYTLAGGYALASFCACLLAVFAGAKLGELFWG